MRHCAWRMTRQKRAISVIRTGKDAARVRLVVWQMSAAAACPMPVTDRVISTAELAQLARDCLPRVSGPTQGEPDRPPTTPPIGKERAAADAPATPTCLPTSPSRVDVNHVIDLVRSIAFPEYFMPQQQPAPAADGSVVRRTEEPRAAAADEPPFDAVMRALRALARSLETLVVTAAWTSRTQLIRRNTAGAPAAGDTATAAP